MSRSCGEVPPGSPAPVASCANACYSLVAPDYGISVANVYDVVNGKLNEIKGSGGVSPRDASPEFRKLEADYGVAWYNAIANDAWGTKA